MKYEYETSTSRTLEYAYVRVASAWWETTVRNCRGVLRDRTSPVASVMSIRRYFKPTNQLPDPWGSLSAAVPPAAIAISMATLSSFSSLRGTAYRYPPFAARGATSSIDAHLHAPRATCKNIFVQFNLYENYFTRTFFSRKFTKRKKSELR